MSGTVSYDSVQLRNLNYDELLFATSYCSLLSGENLESYYMSNMYRTLTGIDDNNTYKMHDDINYIINGSNYEINKEVTIGRNRLLSLLQDDTIRHFISLNNQYNLLLRIIKSMNNTLPDDILEKILIYMESISGDRNCRSTCRNLSKKIINDTFSSVKFDRSSNNPYHIFENMKNLMEDQITHFRSGEIGCNIWHIEGKHGDYALGSICLFYNSAKPMILNGKFGVMIQDIVKYPIPFLVQFLFPSYNTFIPKLNTVLETPINIIASYIGVDYIFVRPISNQGSILIKHYGYTPINSKLTYPCETISIGFSQWLFKEVDKDYH